MINNLRYLIVNADDFGYSPGVSDGIIEAHLNGIVTSTSVMVTMPAAEESLTRALEEAPRLGLGLHLTLTAGKPRRAADDIPHLVDENGHFYSRNDMRQRIDELPLEEVAHEFRAQIAHFQAMTGKLPDHLDSHHHITYMTAPLYNLLVDLADEYDLPIRRGYTQHEATAAQHFANVYGIPADDQALERYQTFAAQQKPLTVPTTDHINLDYYGRHTALGDLLLHLVDTPEGTTELMCHPGRIDSQLQATSSYLTQREQELHALTQRSARELCTAEGIVLITFGQLVNVSQNT